MELLICVMIALIVFATYLVWPMLRNFEDADGPGGGIGPF